MRKVLISRVLVACLVVGIIGACLCGFGSPIGLEGSGQRRIGTATVYTAVQVSASGRLTKTAFEALTCPKINLGASGDGVRRRGVELGAASTGSASSTFTVTAYACKAGFATSGGNNSTDWELQLLGSFVCTVGSGTGATDSGAVLTSERIVNSFVWTPATASTTPPGISAYLTSAYGAGPVTTYSPAGALPAKIIFTDCGNAGCILLDVGSTGGSSVVFYADSGT